MYGEFIFFEFCGVVVGCWKSGDDGAARGPALGLVAQVEGQQCVAAVPVVDKECLDMRHELDGGSYAADSKREKFAASHHYAGKNNIGTDDCRHKFMICEFLSAKLGPW